MSDDQRREQEDFFKHCYFVRGAVYARQSGNVATEELFIKRAADELGISMGMAKSKNANVQKEV